MVVVVVEDARTLALTGAVGAGFGENAEAANMGPDCTGSA